MDIETSEAIEALRLDLGRMETSLGHEIGLLRVDMQQMEGSLRDDMQQAAHRFGLLRQAVLRAQAQSQRAVQSLLPQQATGTYGRLAGQNPSTGGAGHGYLSA